MMEVLGTTTVASRRAPVKVLAIPASVEFSHCRRYTCCNPVPPGQRLDLFILGPKMMKSQGEGITSYHMISPWQVTTTPSDFEAFCRSEDAEAVGVVQFSWEFSK